MLDHVNLSKVLVLDIETVPMVQQYEHLPSDFRELWDEKARFIKFNRDELSPAELFDRAGIFAEFGKIICISFGLFRPMDNGSEEFQFRVKSFYGDDERAVLINFIDLLNKHYCAPPEDCLCAHNGREFDFPYIARRILINGFSIPAILDIAGKKPWDADHLLDTMQLWRFGDFKSFTSLNLLTSVFNIPSPKNDISGSDVFRVYYEEKDIERIAAYCQQDVIATGRLLMKLKGFPVFNDDDIVIVQDE